MVRRTSAWCGVQGGACIHLVLSIGSAQCEHPPSCFASMFSRKWESNIYCKSCIKIPKWPQLKMSLDSLLNGSSSGPPAAQLGFLAWTGTDETWELFWRPRSHMLPLNDIRLSLWDFPSHVLLGFVVWHVSSVHSPQLKTKLFYLVMTCNDVF